MRYRGVGELRKMRKKMRMRWSDGFERFEVRKAQRKTKAERINDETSDERKSDEGRATTEEGVKAELLIDSLDLTECESLTEKGVG